MFNNVGSINDSRINVKKCASRNGLKLRSANTARSMRCNTAVQDHGRRLNQSHFRSMAEVTEHQEKSLCKQGITEAKMLHKGQLSRSCRRVNRFAGCLFFNGLAVARGKPTIIISKTQQFGSIHSKQFFTNKTLSMQCNFIHCFAKLATT